MASNVPSNAELAQQLQALPTIVTNLASTIAGNQLPLAAKAPPAVAVATSPGMAGLEELIDYTTNMVGICMSKKQKLLELPSA